MEKLTVGYEDFIKERELNNKGRQLFDKAVKKLNPPKKKKK